MEARLKHICNRTSTLRIYSGAFTVVHLRKHVYGIAVAIMRLW